MVAWPSNFIFGLEIHLQNIWGKFQFQGHGIKVTVTAVNKQKHVTTGRTQFNIVKLPSIKLLVCFVCHNHYIILYALHSCMIAYYSLVASEAATSI